MTTPEDAAAFKRMLIADPENKKCFECGYPNPMWCDISHGVFICLNCSGKHRGLGVHLVFVRSATIDDWTSWQPEKLRQMEIGGNKRARLFFERNGVPPSGDCSKPALQARYEHNAALMYADLLATEAQGKTFNEFAWNPPEWKARIAAQKQQQQQYGGVGGGGSSGSDSRFQGVGSAPLRGGGNNNNNQGNEGGDWLKTFSDGWSKVSKNTAELVDTTSKQLKESHLQERAQEKASWAWGSVAYYASSIGKLASDVTANLGATTEANGEDDGLSSLTSNVKTVDKPKDDTRYASIEHRSEVSSQQPRGAAAATSSSTGGGWGSWFGGGGTDEDDNGFASLKSDLPKGSVYQGVGATISSPTPLGKTSPTGGQRNVASPVPSRQVSSMSISSPTVNEPAQGPEGGGVRVLKLGEKRAVPIKKVATSPPPQDVNAPSPAVAKSSSKGWDSWDDWGDVEKDE